MSTIQAGLATWSCHVLEPHILRLDHNFDVDGMRVRAAVLSRLGGPDDRGLRIARIIS